MNAGNIERLAEDHPDLLEDDFDFEISGARLMERDITAIILETPKQAINDLLETEPGQQKQYKLAEAMTNRLNSGEF